MSGLSEIPLPNGTDVTLRRDLAHGLPDGIAGRVHASNADGSVQVALIGGRMVTVPRAAVVPAKAGQWRFAQRRAETWGALHGAIVLETIVGSRAWGLAEEGSDTDRRGLFAAPFSLRLGLVSPPEDLVSADGSASYWELGKGLRQALRNDPNTLEMLFVPSARATDEIGQWILDAREAFPSKEMLGSFGRYALSQLRKLASTARLHAHREQIFSWLRKEPALTLDATARRLVRVSAGPLQDNENEDEKALFEAKERIKQLYRSLADRQVLPEATFAALARFSADPQAWKHGEDALSESPIKDDLPAPLRPKNAYNLLRLMATAEHWLTTGTPKFAFEGPLREHLLAIKHGKVPLEEVLKEATERAQQVEEAHAKSPLPARADIVAADRLLRRCNEELLRRHAAKIPGIFGIDAPAPSAPDDAST